MLASNTCSIHESRAPALSAPSPSPLTPTERPVLHPTSLIRHHRPRSRWSNGGRTKLANLISLCKYHHKLIHDRGYLIEPGSGGTFTFYRTDGAPIQASPALPHAAGTIGGCHDADITPDTIIPAWYGERLNLDHAIYVCLANAENKARRLGAAGGWGGPGSARVSSTG